LLEVAACDVREFVKDDFFDAVEGFLADENYVVGALAFGAVVDTGVGASGGKEASPLFDFSQVVFEATALFDNGVEVFVSELPRFDLGHRLAR